MSDSIKKDDEKFSELVNKQSRDVNFDVHSRPSSDVIENDDDRLEDLAFLQDMTQGPQEHASIEEKYEEEIMISEVTKMLDRDLRRRLDDGEDPFAEFFKEKEDEQW